MSSPRFVLLPILIGALLLQGVVALIPHQHLPEMVHTDTDLGDHWCTHHIPEAFPTVEIHATSPCLACVLPTPAFHRQDGLPLIINLESTSNEPVMSHRSSTLVRRWNHQHRGPPFLT